MPATFSVLTTVFDPVPDHLRACLRSVAEQSTPAIEHIVVDDRSSDLEVVELLRQAGQAGSISLVSRQSNGGTVVASADALDAAGGEWVVLLDHDDELAPGAIASLAGFVAGHPDVDVVYSDHDIIRPDGRHADPVFKPDFSPERLRQTNYITHLVAIRRSALREVGGFRTGTDGAQDHDALLRLMELGRPFGHIPEVLVHWRQSPRSVATDVSNKPEAFDRGVEVVQAHLDRSGISGRATRGAYPGVYRIDRSSPEEAVVSVVIPTNGATGEVWGSERTFVCDAVGSLVRRSTHRRFEFVVVADEGTPELVIERLHRIVAVATGVSLRVVPFSGPFNFSKKINIGVEHATGDLLLLLNDDTRLVAPDSVSVMASHLLPEGTAGPGPGDVGVVGAKLLYSDGTLQHGGHVYHHEFMHALIGWPGDHPGPHRMLVIERETSGVTAAALMTTPELYREVGGFPEDLPLHFNDVDFCVSARSTGHRILWTPYASWYHFEGKSRSRGATIDEWNRVAARWPGGDPLDPYSNPNLVPKRSDWLELPGRSGAPPYVIDADGVKRWG